jgi:hypothetical protein
MQRHFKVWLLIATATRYVGPFQFTLSTVPGAEERTQKRSAIYGRAISGAKGATAFVKTALTKFYARFR